MNHWDRFVLAGIAKASLTVAAFGGAMYGLTASASIGSVATGHGAAKVIVETPVNWSQVIAEAMPAVIALILAPAAYLKSRTNQQLAVTAQVKASDTAARVDAVTQQVNGSLSQTQERVARLEGLVAGPAVIPRDPIQPTITPLPKQP